MIEKIVEADRWMEPLLPGSDCVDEGALFSIQDDHSTCLDTSLWDPSADDSSRLSAQEDTAAHIGNRAIQGEITSSDGMQWHARVPNKTLDNGQFNRLSYAEGVVGDSIVDAIRTDTRSEGS